MARRLGSVDLTHEQLLEAVTLLNHIERAAADIARDRPELDEFVGDVRECLRDLRTIFRTPATESHAMLLRRLLEEVEAIDRRMAVH